jgi:hypothetical protein
MTEPKPLSERQSTVSKDDLEMTDEPPKEGGTTMGDKADIDPKLQKEFDLKGDEGDEDPPKAERGERLKTRRKDEETDPRSKLRAIKEAKYGN